MSAESDSKKRQREEPDAGMECLYVYDGETERPDLLDDQIRIAAALHTFRLIKIVVDKRVCDEDWQQDSRVTFVFTMKRDNTVLEAEVWVRSDGGYHRDTAGIGLLVDGTVVAGSHRMDNANFDKNKMCRLFGLPESDGNFLCAALKKTLERDWFERVKRCLEIERKKCSDGKDDKNYLRMALACRAAAKIRFEY